MATRRRLLAMLSALGGGLAAGACGSSPSPTYGDVMLTVTAPAGAGVKSIDYTLDDKVEAATHGTLSGSQSQTQFVQLIPHVPVSEDYLLTAHAQAAEGQMTCMGSAPVKVRTGLKTIVAVALKCAGHVTVGIGVRCGDTALVDFVVSAQQAPVGAFVLARASAAQPDAGALTYAWSAPSGTFSDPTASQTRFTCTQVGVVQLTLKVQDDEMCVQNYAATVTCLAPSDAGAG